MKFDPLPDRGPDPRQASMIVVVEDGIDDYADGVTSSCRGREACQRFIRACSGLSRAGVWPHKEARKPRLFSCNSHTELLNVFGYKDWEATRRHGRITSLSFAPLGVRITLYPSTPYSPNAWLDFLEWGSSRGMYAGGLGSMGRQLWKSTLEHVAILNGFRGRTGLDEDGTAAAKAAYFGARKEAPYPSTFKDVTYWDLRSAYPSVSASSPLALGMKEIKVGPRYQFPTHEQGIAYAGVVIGRPSPWGPMPIRVTDHAYQFGYSLPRMGHWTFRDLACAQDRGDFVRIERAWVPTQESAFTFGPDWLTLVRRARELPAPVAWWAKRAINACWGTFALDPGKSDKLTWEDDDGLLPQVSSLQPMGANNPLGDTLYIAVELTARCRQRMWDDCIRTGKALYADTDGVILPSGVTPSREGPGLGEWAPKQRMADIEIRGPGIYRYHLADDPGTTERYVTAGVPANPDKQRWLFEQHSPNTIYGAQAFGGDQVVLPPGSSDDDPGTTERYVLPPGSYL